MFDIIALSGLSIVASCQGIAQSDSRTSGPFEYKSPCGQYQMHVSLGDQRDSGGNRYELTRLGRKVWAKTFPFILSDACLLSSGVVLGYSYSRGLRGAGGSTTDETRFGHLRLTIIDVNGNLQLDDTLERTESRLLHGSPTPTCRGIVPMEDQGLVVFRLKYAELSETWRIYDLALGSVVENAVPRIGTVQSLCPIVGAPLLLAQAYDLENLSVSIHDLTGASVWEWTIAETEGHLSAPIVASSRQSHRFVIEEPVSNVQITGSVESLGIDGWVVRKMSQGELTQRLGPEISSPRVAAVTASLRVRTATTNLGGTDVISSIHRLDADDRGHIGILATGDAGRTMILALIDESGEVVSTCWFDSGISLIRGFVWIGEHNWLISGCSDPFGTLGFWIVDLERRTVRLWTNEVRCESILALAGSASGFVAAMRRPGQTRDELVSYSRECMEEWAELLPIGAAVNGLAITTSGDVVAVDSLGKKLIRYDSEGNRLADWNLRTSVMYPTRASAEPDGGVLVVDTRADSQVTRLGAKGQPKAVLNLGVDAPGLLSHVGVAVSANGTLWTAEDRSVMRIDNNGSVEVVLEIGGGK